ncbi:MAG: squalene synthase HpnC [Thiobacillaceae bacterium]
MSVGHYENFPVASLVLPRSLRRPVKAIYAFARSADDLADEGQVTPQSRLKALNIYRQELDAIVDPHTSDHPILNELGIQIRERDLPLQPFHDLLDAFIQDVEKTRYANFGEVMHYCRHSANPIGRLMLLLYGQTDPRNYAYSDGICSALQLINFLQDVAIDWRRGRVYLPQDELTKAGLSDALLGKLVGDTTSGSNPPQGSGPTVKSPIAIPIVSFQAGPESRWRDFMFGQIDRAHNMLQAGAPLGLILKGRIGFELRMMIAGGDRILRKLHTDPMSSLRRRPTLNIWDWIVMFTRALLKK